MLGAYLQAWFPIIASRFSDVGLTYAEGFAGPGEYEHGEVGSPIIAMDQANRQDVLRSQAPIRVVLVEKSKKRYEHLSGLLDRRYPVEDRSGRLRLEIVRGECEVALLPALDRLSAWDGPMFVNLDGWGVDTPFEIVKRVGSVKSAEVLVTFQSQWFVRFATLDESEAGDRVFGDPGWRAVVDQPTPEAKKRFLVDRYRSGLAGVGFPYSLTFEMIDEGGHELFLIFGTQNELGVEKMKDAMWKVDAVSGQRFRDPRDLNQLAFSIDEPDLSSLKKEILDQVDAGRTNLAELKVYALLETVFRPPHVSTAVAALCGEGKLQRSGGRSAEETTLSRTNPTLFG